MFGDVYTQLMHQVKHHRHIAASQRESHIRVKLMHNVELGSRRGKSMFLRKCI